MPLDNHDSDQLPPRGTYETTCPPAAIGTGIVLPTTHFEHSITQKAARTLKNVARAATEASKVEPFNKQRCLDFQLQVRAKQAKKFSLKTRLPIRARQTACEMNIGHYVVVEPDLTPGIKSFGGKGWIHRISREGTKTFVDVEYIETEAFRFEKHIPLKRVVVQVPPQQYGQLKQYSINTRQSTKVQKEMTILPRSPNQYLESL